MDTITINFKASGQNLTADAHPQRYASNTVNYIQAVFDLDENWQRFDSVRAVWHNDFACISTVLDGDGACTVPHEVLTNLDEVHVNLVGSDVDGEELVDRMTTYPLRVVIIDAHARICGTETAEVTPSQFEQYVAIVRELVADIKDIDSVELNADYTLTISFSDGTETTVGPIRGEQGETGNGIASAVLNDDYTLTLTFTDGTSYTTPSIRGEQGEQGEPGEVTLAQLSAVLPTDTASGAIASFPDGSDLFDYLSCVCDINPLQDLHGYDKPWVGGAGVNKASNIASDYSRVADYWTFPIDLTQGETYTIWIESLVGTITGYAFGIAKSGTRYSDFDSLNLRLSTNGTIYPAAQFTVDNTYTAPVIAVYAGSTQTDLETFFSKVHFQVEKGSSKTSYEPYSNICPITGWTGCEVDVCGVNIFDEQTLVSLCSAVKQSDGTYYISNLNSAYDKKIWNNPTGYEGQLTITFIRKQASNGTGLRWKVYYTDGTNESIGNVDQNADIFTTYTLVTNASKVVDYIVGDYGNNKATYCNIQVETGSTATDYEPYNGTTYPVSWQTEAGTVYGGTVDAVSGVLTVAWASSKKKLSEMSTLTPLTDCDRYRLHAPFASVATETSTLWKCDTLGYGLHNLDNPHFYYSKTQDNIELFVPRGMDTNTEIHFVAQLATPQTYQLTPTQVHALLGQNNVWADCGDVEVQYKADVQRWVEKKLGA